MAEPDLAALVAQSQRMVQQTTGPALQRNLAVISEEAKRLVAKIAAPGVTSAATGRAEHLLAARGYDTQRQARAIEQINLAGTFEPLEALQPADVNGYLRHERDLILSTAVEESRRETLRAYEAAVTAAAQAEWEQTKRRIFEELGHAAAGVEMLPEPALGAAADASFSSSRFGDLTYDPNASMLATSMLNVSQASSFAGGEPVMPPLLHMHARMMNYAACVERLNQARLEGQPYNFGAACRDAAARLDRETVGERDSSWSSYTFCWDLWQHIFAETAKIDAGRDVPSRSGLAQATAPPVRVLYDEESPRLRQRLVVASRTFLEQQFEQFMDGRIAAHLREAQVGGVPGIKEKTLAYLKVLLAQLERTTPALLQRLERNQSGVAVWAHLYLMVRSGHPREALELAQGAYADYFRAREPNFPAALQAFLASEDGSLPGDLRGALQQRRGDYSDPFRQVLVKILTRADLAHKTVPDVIKSSDDYLWLQLYLVRVGSPVPEARAAEAYPLQELQASLTKLGPKYFNASGRGTATNPLKYFIVLVLSVQYEQAIQYLFSVDGAQADAVHMAVAAVLAGLLHVQVAAPAEGGALGAFGPLVAFRKGARGGERAELDLAQLLQRYCRQFIQTDPERAFQYYLLLTLVPTDAAAETARALTRQLVLDSRQFTTLVGAVQPDGRLRPGQLQRFAPLLHLSDVDAFRDAIVADAAAAAQAAGRAEDALLLYNLAQDYDSVLRVVTARISDCLFQTSDAERADLKSFLTFYEANGLLARLDPAAVAQCQNVFLLDEAAAALRDGRADQALRLWEASGYLPFGAQSSIEACLERLQTLPPRVLPDLLVLAETAVHRLYQTLLGSAPDPGRQQEMARLQQASRRLIALTGRLQQRLPAETYSRLSQMDVYMS